MFLKSHFILHKLDLLCYYIAHQRRRGMEKQIYKEVILDLLDENEINSIKNRFYLLMGYDLEIYNKYKEEFNKLSDIYMF